jgi:hypothetical protein
VALLREPGPTFAPERLASAFAQLPVSAWAQPVTSQDEVNPGYQFAVLVQAQRQKAAASLFRFVLNEFEPVWTAWIAKVPAGGFIGPHIDEGPYHERWHVPIVPAGTFDGRNVEAGISFPVHHWEPHRVDNPTDQPRIHLVIDRVEMVDVPNAPFQRIEETYAGQDA